MNRLIVSFAALILDFFFGERPSRKAQGRGRRMRSLQNTSRTPAPQP